MVDVGLIGFGMAGALFHAPLIRDVPRLRLAAVVTSRAERAAELGADVRILPDASQLIADPTIDLIVIATPNQSHLGLAEAALDAGKHVVVDKPFMPRTEDARAVIARAARRGRVLSVFRNRRWDGDFLTVQSLLGSGTLGALSHFEARWDRLRPNPGAGWREQAAPGSGLLFDLGPHLIDQALCLFGRPEAIFADVERQRAGAQADDYFELQQRYGATRVILGASMLLAAPRPRFAVHGTRGSFIKHGFDPQAAQLAQGMRADDPGYGRDQAAEFGLLTIADGSARPLPTETGNYTRFYEAMADAILDGAPPPVDPEDALLGLHILETAVASARQRRLLALEPAR